MCCVQQCQQPSCRLHPSVLQVPLITGASTPHTQPSGWLARPALFTKAACFLQSLISFSIYRVSAFDVHCGSCTHRSSCLYMWEYFQTEKPVKDIHRARGEVAVFYPSCLFTITLSVGCRGKWWMKTIRGRTFSFNSEKLNQRYQNSLTFPSKFHKWPKQPSASHWLSFFLNKSIPAEI